MKKLIKSVKLIILTAILSVTSYSLAVYDSANHASNLLQQAEAVKNTVEAVNQTRNQLEQIKQNITNMASLGRELTTGQLDMLQKDLVAMVNIRNKVRSEINDYKRFETSFNNLYKNVNSFDRFSYEDRAMHTNRLLNETQNVLSDAYRVLEIGDVEKINNDAMRISAIMRAANDAEGQKAVLQASSNLAGMQIQILGEQRTLMAEGLKAQNAFMLQQTQEKAIDQGMVEQFRERSPEVRSTEKVSLPGFNF